MDGKGLLTLTHVLRLLRLEVRLPRVHDLLQEALGQTVLCVRSRQRLRDRVVGRLAAHRCAHGLPPPGEPHPPKVELAGTAAHA
eukprot:scaffold11902_cov112-Isochrysis_galbana.AAC.5